MHQRCFLIFALAGLLFVLHGGCSDSSTTTTTSSDSGSKQVVGTNFPLYCLVKGLCESTDVKVHYVGPTPGFSGETGHWSPDEKQIRKLQSASLVFRNGRGAEFAEWIKRVTLDESKLKSATDSMDLTDFVIVKGYGTVHRHGPEGEHAHASIVSRCWLSPKIASKQIAWCRDQMLACYPEHKAAFESNFLAMDKELKTIQGQWESASAKLQGRSLVTSNPEANYMFQSMGITTVTMNWRELPDRGPANEQIDKAINEQESGADAIFVWTLDPEDDAVKQAVDSKFGSSCTLDLIDRGNETDGFGEYIKRLRHNSAAVMKAISTTGAMGESGDQR